MPQLSLAKVGCLYTVVPALLVPYDAALDECPHGKGWYVVTYHTWCFSMLWCDPCCHCIDSAVTVTKRPGCAPTAFQFEYNARG